MRGLFLGRHLVAGIWLQVSNKSVLALSETKETGHPSGARPGFDRGDGYQA